MKSKFFKTILSSFLISLIILGNTISVFADTFKIGALSSWNGPVTVSPGDTLDLKLQLANQSSCTNSNKTNFETRIYINPKEKNPDKYKNLSLEDQEKVMALKWISFSNKYTDLKVGEQNSTDIHLSIPVDAALGEYTVLLNVSSAGKCDEKSTVNVNINTKIEVPLIIEVVNGKTKTNGLTESSKIEGYTVSDKLDDTSVLDILKGILIPNSKWKSNVENLLTKPYKFSYYSGDKVHTIIDVPALNKTILRNVVTNNKSSLNNYKYIYIPKEVTPDSEVKSLTLNGNIIKIVTSHNKQYNIETPDADTALEINNQINKQLSKIEQIVKKYGGNSIPFSYILDNVQLYSSEQIVQPILYVKYKIKNTGTKTIFPKGVLVATQKGNIIDNANYSSVIIQPGEEKEIIAELNYGNLNLSCNSSYAVKSVVLPSSHAKQVTLDTNITFTHVRILIFILIIAILLGVIVLIILLIYKNKKSIKNTNVKSKETDIKSERK